MTRKKQEGRRFVGDEISMPKERAYLLFEMFSPGLNKRLQTFSDEKMAEKQPLRVKTFRVVRVFRGSYSYISRT
jgi:hypothetical protein